MPIIWAWTWKLLYTLCAGWSLLHYYICQKITKTKISVFCFFLNLPPSIKQELLKLVVYLDVLVARHKFYRPPRNSLSLDCSPGSTAAVGLKQPTGSRALICVWPWRKPERDAIIWCMALHHTNQWQIGLRDPKYTAWTQIQPLAGSLNYLSCLYFNVGDFAANKERLKGRIIKIKMCRHAWRRVILISVAVNYSFCLKWLHLLTLLYSN